MECSDTCSDRMLLKTGPSRRKRKHIWNVLRCGYEDMKKARKNKIDRKIRDENVLERRRGKVRKGASWRYLRRERNHRENNAFSSELWTGKYKGEEEEEKYEYDCRKGVIPTDESGSARSSKVEKF